MNLRFSLFSLICLTSFAALACAALARPDAGWLSLIVTSVVIVFAVQFLRALLLTECARASAIGWLLFASAYLAVTIGPWLNQNVGPSLLSSRGLAFAQSHAPWNPSVINSTVWSTDNVTPGVPFSVEGTADWVLDFSGQVVGESNAWTVAACFHLTGHWLLAFVFGGMGAMLGGWLERRRAGPLPAPLAIATTATAVRPATATAPG